MSVEKKAPGIRFKGFSGDWEERSLGEIGTLKNGMNFDKAAMGHGYPFINLQDVFGKNEVSCNNLGLAFSTENQRKDYSLDKGDVLFIRSSVKPEGVGEAAVVPKAMINTTYSGFIIRFRPSIEMDVNFNRFAYSTAKCRKQILASSTSSANSNINQESLQRIQLSLPSKPEQTAIGNYFQKLDNLINQHQQKHDKLSNIKKAMLEKMFPKEGETVPEIRFKGFSEEWEEKELGEAAPLRGGFAFQSSEFCDSGIPIVKISNILATGEVGGEFNYYKEIISDENYLLLDGAALLAMSGATTGKVSILKCHHETKFYQNQRVGYFQRNIYFDYLFISTLVRSHIFRDKLDAVLVAGAQPNVSSKEIDSFKFMMPNDFEEQTAIGNYFQKLDALINRHQQQITKLNNIKLACLSKMFV